MEDSNNVFVILREYIQFLFIFLQQKGEAYLVVALRSVLVYFSPILAKAACLVYDKTAKLGLFPTILVD